MISVLCEIFCGVAVFGDTSLGFSVSSIGSYVLFLHWPQKNLMKAGLIAQSQRVWWWVFYTVVQHYSEIVRSRLYEAVSISADRLIWLEKQISIISCVFARHSCASTKTTIRSMRSFKFFAVLKGILGSLDPCRTVRWDTQKWLKLKSGTSFSIKPTQSKSKYTRKCHFGEKPCGISLVNCLWACETAKFQWFSCFSFI